METTPLTISDFSSYGWAVYFAGGMLSFSRHMRLALLISAVGLMVIVMAAATHPKDPRVLLQVKKFNWLAGILFLSFLACAFLQWISLAFLLLGSLLFLYGCFGLKHRAIYLNGSFFDPYGTRYARETNPFFYWGATVLFLSLGASLLLATLWANQGM